MKIRPLHDRVVVRRKEEVEKTAGGIVLPGASKEKPSQGEIIAVGEGTVDAKGEVKPLSVEVGNVVVFGKSSGNTVKIDDEEFLIMRENEIYGIIE